MTLFVDFNVFISVFGTTYSVIWRKIHGYLHENTLQSEENCTVIWCNLHVFSTWFHLDFRLIFPNILIANELQTLQKQRLFEARESFVSNTQAMRGYL